MEEQIRRLDINKGNLSIFLSKVYCMCDNNDIGINDFIRLEKDSSWEYGDINFITSLLRNTFKYIKIEYKTDNKDILFLLKNN